MRSGIDIDIATALKRATESKRLRDIVGIIFHQCFFDKKIKVIFRKAQATAVLDIFRQRLRHAVSDRRDKRAIGIAENRILFRLARDQQIRQSIADGIGDLSQRKLRFIGTGSDRNFGMRAVKILTKHLAPRELRISDRGAVRDNLFQGEVFF